MTKVIIPATNLPTYVVQETSAKTGNPYYQLCVDIDDKYTIKKFVTDTEVERIRLKTDNSDPASAL